MDDPKHALRPLRIGGHVEHRLEARVALLDEAGQLRAVRCLEHFTRAGNDGVRRFAAGASLRLLRDRSEMLEIGVVEVEGDADHGSG